jgi:mannosylglycerate hydrolase
MQKQVLLYLHTHWDREWYRSFESYRIRLCEVVKNLIETLEKNPEQVFMLDGQTAVVEDFLELYPDWAPRLEALIAREAIHIGPWYVLPDEFLVSGESLIRNLLIGTQQASTWGQKQFYGYLPDMFGHLAQMPQILKQAQLEPAVLWRGVNPLRNIFFWSGLDGSLLTSLHLTKGYYQDIFHAQPFSEENLKAFLKPIEESTPIPAPILLPVGGDHLGLPPHFEKDLQAFNQSQTWYDLQPSSLGDYMSQIKSMSFAMETIHGELRNCDSAYILPGVLSTRRYLKAENDRIQNLLTHQIEPLQVLSLLNQGPNSERALRQAWKYLLLNHPHDSICGCSIDEVHQDMMPRFRWAESLGQELKTLYLNHLLKVGQQGAKGEFLHLLNLGNTVFKGTLKVEIEFPAELAVSQFALKDNQGLPVLCEILQIEQSEKFIAEPDILPHWENIIRFSCLIHTEIAPLSDHVYTIVPHEVNPTLTPMRSASDPCSIENHSTKVVLDVSSGKLRIYRNDNHTWVRHLDGHIFVDSGDAGDSYNYSPPQDDSSVVLHVQEFQVEKQALCQTLYLTYYGFLPAQLKEDRQSRSGVNTPCWINTEIRLYSNDPSVHFSTVVQNTARDHRLRLVFNSQPGHLRCWSSTAFGVIERKLPPPRVIDTPKGKERPADTFPFDDWIHISAPDDQGYVLHMDGVHEAAIMEWEGRPSLALTLLRCVGWLSRDDLRTRGGGAGPRMRTPEAQCLGEHRFDYRLFLSGNSRQEALKQVFQWQHPPLVSQGHQAQALPTLFKLKGEGISITTIKQAETDDAIILRLFNALEHPVHLEIQPGFACRDICLSDTLEKSESRERLNPQADSWQILCQPYEILTFKFWPSKAEE